MDNYLSILFKATTNGHFFSFKRPILSTVCGSNPCIISTTKIAISQRDDPRLRKLLNDSCPGVSIINNPGSLNFLSAICKFRNKNKISIKFINKIKHQLKNNTVAILVGPRLSLIPKLLSTIQRYLPNKVWMNFFKQ